MRGAVRVDDSEAVAVEEVGGGGFVLGADIQQIAKFSRSNVATIVADITKPETRELVKAGIPRAADVVISDVSPSISGVWDVDQARSVELVRSALGIAEGVLAPGGKFLVKVFQGEMFNDFLKEIRQRFEFVKVSKPMASRKGSAEVYVVGKGFKRPLGFC